MSTSGSGRLRADAARNRDRVLVAAAQVFARRGLSATLHDVAAEAGVGVGTVYRRFPDKDALIDALFETRTGTLLTEIEQLATHPDPWQALVDILTMVTEAQAGDIGLRQLFSDPHSTPAPVAEARRRVIATVDEVLTRAYDDGRVRPGIVHVDMALVWHMLTSVASYTAPARPDAWKRYLEIVMDGLRARPEHTVPEVPALSESEMSAARAVGGPPAGRRPGT